MSKLAPPTSNDKPKTKGKKPLVPPDERFWKRYSPHHEFPLSTAASFVLHVLAIGLLVIGAILLARIGLQDKPPEVGAIAIGGGGGNPDGAGDGPNTNVIPQGTERAETIKQQTPNVVVPPQESLTKAEARPPVLADPNDTEAVRVVDASAALAALSDTGRKAHDAVEKALSGRVAGKGEGGTGEGGGKGKGKGTGTGDDQGPGSGKITTQRQKRQLRWVMMFNTFNGQDYAKQLNGLGAILAIQQPDGQFMLYRDLSRAPAQGKIEDLAGLDRIYWVDDKQQSVQSLAMALGITPPPTHIVAFFPKELEDQLLKKELAYLSKARKRNAKEDDIRETRFQVLPRGGRYEPEVVSQNFR